MPDVRPLTIADVLEIIPRRFADERGFFVESWNRDTWQRAGIALEFVQDNHSLSRQRGVLRGLHYQLEPFAQHKLVRVTRGSVWDVAVDIRRASPTFGQWVALTLSADRGNQLLVPAGFAHGFVTLEPDTEVQYKVTAVYSPEHERTIRFDDARLAIDWPVATDEITLSEKDGAALPLASVSSEDLPA